MIDVIDRLRLGGWLIVVAVLPLAARADEGEPIARGIQALLRAHTEDVRACVGANDQPGEALLDLVAGKDRRVLAARVLKADAPVAAAAACVARRAGAWRLDSLPVDEGDQIVVPLVFRPEPKLEARVVEVVKQLVFPEGLHAAVLLAGGPATFEGKRRVPLPPHGAVVTGQGGTVRCDRCRLLVMKTPHDGAFVGASSIDFNALPSYALPGKGGTVQLGTDGTPSIPFALDWMEVKAGVTVPVHTHDRSIELVYIVEGRGAMTRGAEQLTVAAGQIVQIPAGVPHSLQTTTALVAVQLYSPRGPEQRFKK